MWKHARRQRLRTAAAGGRHRGVRPRHARRSGRRRASSASPSRGCCPPTRLGQPAARARAGHARRCERDGLLDPARKRALPPFPRTHRRGHEPRRRGAARHHHRRPEALAARCELLLVGAQVQGDEAVRDAGARARARSTGSTAWTCCIIGRGGGAREDLAAFNDGAGLPGARGGAGADHLRRRPRDRHHALRPRRRPPRRRRRPPRPSWPCPTGREVLRRASDALGRAARAAASRRRTRAGRASGSRAPATACEARARGGWSRRGATGSSGWRPSSTP